MESLFIEKQIHLADSNIFYQEAGTATNSVSILFIHGWSVSIEPYQENLNMLSQRYHVVAPYLPGFGKSTAPHFVKDYSDYAAVLIDFLKALNLQSVHIVGHSLGGAIAMALAALKPDFTRSLIVVDSTGIPMNSLPEVVVRRAIEMSAQMWQAKPEPALAILARVLYNSLFNTKKVLETAKLVLDRDIRSMLPRIHTPCLIIWGADDLLTPMTMAKEFARNIKGSKLVIIDGVYHEWNFFFTETFTKTVSNFIDEIELGTGNLTSELF
ncbi:alpha/beta hydrolase [Phormidium sp. LEGE 05292]|uniref:alpha/beta fold hydrolase n=1 Tax=[Phormidium] sp. LEGE 05292 TaxID=767427 RepID=UPI00187F06CC|nr:alpha/beta hydrolase [Phormidium sp. LEGE 05292]MBE9223945.1 alpha/beta hydrolase [Phormidium sp. LEGE 05292]